MIVAEVVLAAIEIEADEAGAISVLAAAAPDRIVVGGIVVRKDAICHRPSMPLPRILNRANRGPMNRPQPRISNRLFCLASRFPYLKIAFRPRMAFLQPRRLRIP
jgi:hypothetical protein